MDLELFVTPGLGDASYLLASGREAVLVDPQRDAWRFLEVARERGWRIRHVLETHVHNDYLSGALETQAATGAEIAAPARGGYEFAHWAVDEGDAIEVGSLRLTAWATPGAGTATTARSHGSFSDITLPYTGTWSGTTGSAAIISTEVYAIDNWVGK